MQTKLTRNPAVLRIGFAETISSIGDWITMMAVFAMLVFRGGGGVAESSGVFLAGLLPILPASMAAGWLCDRMDRRTLMIASQILSGVVVSGLFFAHEPWMIYLLLALQAVSISVMGPARQAVIPTLVAKDELVRANAMLQQLASLTKIGAPMLAGAVLAVLDPHQAVLLDVASFLISAAVLTGLPALPPAGKTSGPTDNGEPVPAVSALQLLRQSADLQRLFVGVFFSIAVIVGFDVLASVFIRDVLGEGESFFGLGIGLVGLGTLLASLWLMVRVRKISPWRDMALGLLLLALIPLTLAVSAQIEAQTTARILMLAGCLLGGFGNGLVHIQSATLLQLSSPAAMLGRAGGMMQSTATAGQLIGVLATPLLVPGLLSMAHFFAAAAVLLVFCAGWVAVQWKEPKKSVTLDVPRTLS